MPCHRTVIDKGKVGDNKEADKTTCPLFIVVGIHGTASSSVSRKYFRIFPPSVFIQSSLVKVSFLDNSTPLQYQDFVKTTRCLTIRFVDLGSQKEGAKYDNTVLQDISAYQPSSLSTIIYEFIIIIIRDCSYTCL